MGQGQVLLIKPQDIQVSAPDKQLQSNDSTNPNPISIDSAEVVKVQEIKLPDIQTPPVFPADAPPQFQVISNQNVFKPNPDTQTISEMNKMIAQAMKCHGMTVDEVKRQDYDGLLYGYQKSQEIDSVSIADQYEKYVPNKKPLSQTLWGATQERLYWINQFFGSYGDKMREFLANPKNIFKNYKFADLCKDFLGMRCMEQEAKVLLSVWWLDLKLVDPFDGFLQIKTKHLKSVKGGVEIISKQNKKKAGCCQEDDSMYVVTRLALMDGEKVLVKCCVREM